jgi:hypothetical protein
MNTNRTIQILNIKKMINYLNNNIKMMINLWFMTYELLNIMNKI